VAHWGAQLLWPYGTKNFRPFPRKTMHVLAGPPVDLSKYADQPRNAQTLEAATMDIMHALADLLGELRGEKPPEKLYDHHAAVRERRRKRLQQEGSPQKETQQEPTQQEPTQQEGTETE
jgi:hypothetical protein